MLMITPRSSLTYLQVRPPTGLSPLHTPASLSPSELPYKPSTIENRLDRLDQPFSCSHFLNFRRLYQSDLRSHHTGQDLLTLYRVVTAPARASTPATLWVPLKKGGCQAASPASKRTTCTPLTSHPQHRRGALYTIQLWMVPGLQLRMAPGGDLNKYARPGCPSSGLYAAPRNKRPLRSSILKPKN